MAVIPIGDRLNISKKVANIDSRFGPYSSVENAYEVLGPNGEGKIVAGMLFGVIEADGNVTIYKWTVTSGIADDYERVTGSRVIKFAGVTTASVTQSSYNGTGTASTVYYNSSTGGFVVRSGLYYYPNWQNRIVWSKENYAIYDDCIYIDISTNSIYATINGSLTRLTANAPVTSVAGKTGAVVLDKNDVGLGNVDNTADVNKTVAVAVKATNDSDGNAINSTYQKINTLGTDVLNAIRNSQVQVVDLDAQEIVASTSIKVGANNVLTTEDISGINDTINDAVDSLRDDVASTYETKTDSNTKVAANQARIVTLEGTVANLTAINGAIFGGFVIDASDVPTVISTKYTADGYTNEMCLYFGGVDMEHLYAYQYNGTGTPTQVSNVVYNYGSLNNIDFIKGTISSIAGLDALTTSSAVGVYWFNNIGAVNWSGLLVVGVIPTQQVGGSDTITQKLISNRKITYSGDVISYGEVGPATLYRSYDGTSWSKWVDDALTLQTQVTELGAKCDKAVLCETTSSIADLDISDESGYVILRLKGGNLRTKYFNSAPLYEKKISFLGDSITTYDSYAGSNTPFYTGSNAGITSVDMTWWKNLCNIQGAIVNRIYAYGGGNVTNNLCLKYNYLYSNGTSGNSPDYIFILGGINDWYHNIALGTINDAENPNTTFYAAYKYLLSHLKETFPNATIIGLTILNSMINGTSVPYLNTNGASIRNFCDAIIECCNYYSVDYIDLNRMVNINGGNYTSLLADYTHPNYVCSVKMTNAIKNKLLTITFE